MENMRVCRTCLSMNVQLYNLSMYPLSICYEFLIGKNVYSVNQLPMYACFKCTALFKKFYKFRQQSLNSEAILIALLNSSGKISSIDIEEKKSNLVLASNLIVHTLENINLEQCIEIELKLEPTEVKEEDDDFDSHFPATSDDEPLSVHKSNKVHKIEDKKEKVGNKKKKRKRELESDIGGVACESDDQIDDQQSSSTFKDNEQVPVKRKRGRPRKNEQVVRVAKKASLRRTQNTGGVYDDDMDLESFCTIIKLSLEEQKAEIDKRQHSSNYVHGVYQCGLCYKGFIDNNAWKHHLGKHDPKAGDLECQICKIRFKTKRTLQKHASNHEKKYECKSCSYVSKTTTQAKQHQRWHKGVTYKCQYCDEVSTKWTSYLSHVRMKHPSEFICGVCGYSFVSKLGLAMHKTMMHKDIADNEENLEDKDSPYCEECDVKFVSEEAMKRHMVTSVKHTQSRDMKAVNGCRVCGERFADGEQLRLHHRRKHARPRPKNYGKRPEQSTWPTRCTHCPETIPNAREYWTHFRREHPDKNYPIQKNYICDVCGKSFRGNAFLVYHKRTHTGERTFKCSLCSKAFFNRYNLQMHEKTHSDHRPHLCSVCFKAFKCKGALDRHFRSHTGEKPYECELCGKAFAQSNSRKLHVRTVHLKQPSPYISRSRLERRNRSAAHKENAPFAY